MRRKLSILLPLGTLLLLAGGARAGPPFSTDDPQPVDLFHWEFYLASEQQFGSTGRVEATLPHLEINYGALAGVQLHVVAPMGYLRADGRTSYGYGNTEIGMKYRFIGETERVPQAGIFPLVELPTGDRAKDIGSGRPQVFLPVWIQKSWGSLTTYGGGGFWYNPGDGRKNFAFAGWQIQYDFSRAVTLGCEAYYRGADTEDARSAGGISIGGYINLDDNNHILFDIGHSVSGEQFTTGYIGYQVTV